MQASTDGNGHLIDLRGVSKTYHSPAGAFTALKDVNLKVRPGEFVAVVGKSGSGKSTLLNVLTGIDRPTRGAVQVGGAAVQAMSESQIAVWRGQNVGVVFQFFQLLPTLTVLENVLLPMDLRHTFAPREREPRARQLLERMGVADQAHKLPAALSGGQQQRAAIARALANDPPLIVADEPTGNLDSRTAAAVLELFQTLAANGKTVLMVTHERDIWRLATRTVTLADGEIVGDNTHGQAA